jgi:glycerol-3-phosphate dehydrogenase (NAD(P)+)
MKAGVVGAGAWGTALSQVLADNGHQVELFARDPRAVEEINKEHTNKKYYGSEVKISEDVFATADLAACLKGADMAVIAVPVKAYRPVLEEMAGFLSHKTLVVSTAKGFDPTNGKRLSETVRELIPEAQRLPVVSLLGPSYAEEVIKRLLTCLTATSVDLSTAKRAQEIFSNGYFRVYTNTDEIGAEYSAAVKNVVALAAGMLLGLGYGDNARAALVTRGLAEISRLGIKMGGRVETFLGLCGVGDLNLTCSSTLSRNFQAGVAIGKADGAVEFMKNNTMTVEGLKTTQVVKSLACQAGVEMPIAQAVWEVLYGAKKPSDVVSGLMTRQLKREY